MIESTQVPLAIAALIAIAGLLCAAWLGRRRALRTRQERRGAPQRLPRLPRGIDPERLLRTMPVSITITDHLAPGEPLVFGNDHFFETVGHPPEALLGRNLRCLQGADTDPDAVAELSRALAAEQGSRTRLLNYRADGSPFWNLLTIEPLRDAQGRVTQNLGVQLEIDDVIRKENELLLRQRQHFAIAATTQAALEASDLEELLQRSGALAARALRADRVEIVAADHSDHRGTVRTFGTRRDAAADTPVASDCMASHTIREGGVLVSTDLDGDPRFAQGPGQPDPELRSGIATQIVDEARPWGAIAAFGTAREQFGQTDADLLQSMAYLLGSAISRLRKDHQIEDRARFVDTVLDSVSEAIVTIDEEGVIKAANSVLCRIWGHEQDEVVGRKVDMLMNPGDAARHDDYMQRYMKTGNARIIGRGRELEARHANGELFPIWLTITEATLDGKTLYVGTLRDLRREKATQAQLLQAQKMESVGQLTGGLAHDFNNLLTVILGNLSMALEAAPDDDQRALLAGSREAAQRGAELTRGLLAFAGRQSLQPARVELAGLFDSLQPMIQRLLDERYEVTFDIAADTPSPFADGAQLESALLNLAINARDAMPSGGAIRVAAVSRDAMVEISVSDSGPGIPHALRSQVFEPFFTTKAPGKGTGLGLSMVHGFVHQSGGDLLIGEAEGGGARLTLVLPCDGPEASSTANTAAQPAEARTDAADTLRVLLVEDDAMVARIAQRMLARLGHAVTTVEGPEAALGYLQGDAELDLLFTDTVLQSAVSGSDLSRTAADLRPGLALLITSGYTKEADPQGIDDAVFLQKPYSIDELAAGIAAALARRRAKARD